MRWVEIKVEAFDASADAVTEILIDVGCGGTAVSRFSCCASVGAVDVVGYLPMSDRIEESLKYIQDRVRSLPGFGLELRSNEVGVTWVEDDNWATAWRKYFKPIRIGRIVVKPSWEQFAPGPDDIVVELDPGMAFGTGNHASTRLCILALQDFIRGSEVVIDVGTGSGILAITAAKLGASRVTAIDNDPAAVDAARKNVARAKLGEIIDVRLGDSPSVFTDGADVIVANIVPNVIIPMAGELRAAAKTGGVVITSGIVLERAEEVKSSLETAGLETLDSCVDAEWVAITSKKPA